MASTKPAEPEPAQPSLDRQPTPTVAPAWTPPAPVAFPARADRPVRVVVYQQLLTSENAVRELLVRRGFEVRTTGMFHDLGGWLMLYGKSTILVLGLPAIDTFRKAVLKEVRRLGPGIPVIALAKAVTPDVQRDAETARVLRVLPTDADPERIAMAVELARENIRSGSTREPEPSRGEDSR